MDYLTCCPDTAALMDEVAVAAPDRLLVDEVTGDRSLHVAKIPTRRSGSETLGLIRNPDPRLLSLTNLQILGYYDPDTDRYVFTPPSNAATYNRLYPRTPIQWTDEGGKLHIHTPPELIGVFA